MATAFGSTTTALSQSKRRPKSLSAITAPNQAALMRIAWQLGNRHCPTQLDGNRLLIRRDHVVEAMVEGLGGTVTPVRAAFDPEGGAYHGHGTITATRGERRHFGSWNCEGSGRAEARPHPFLIPIGLTSRRSYRRRRR